jgi:hypothetical protein
MPVLTTALIEPAVLSVAADYLGIGTSTRRRSRLRTMSANAGQRQERNQGEQAPTTPDREKFSEAQLAYIDGAAALQVAAVNEPTLNGQDARDQVRAWLRRHWIGCSASPTAVRGTSRIAG